MLFNIPIEDLEERYSAQWNRWFPREFNYYNVPFQTITGVPLTNKIETGAFLDVVGTNYWKACQLQQICELIYSGKIKQGDKLFFHDLWFPGLEMVQYMRQGLGIDFKIYGILHAGTYDPHDFLSQKGMTYWAHKLEESWLSFVDKVFVSTNYHKQLLLENRLVEPSKIVVTGLPIYPEEFVKTAPKENIVVFPHRLDPEKQPTFFNELKRKGQNLNWKFVKTKEICSNKQEYYDLLNRAKIAVSFALQETWGIAQLESLFCGCIPVVPDRLSYSEIYPQCFKCSSDEEVIETVLFLIKNEKVLAQLEKEAKRTAGVLSIIYRYSIKNMLKEMEVI